MKNRLLLIGVASLFVMTQVVLSADDKGMVEQ